ncbi:hypothetical protein DH2020_039644 [Rehmannia glutinosa]|uniref:Pentatricopeptide repeat-containing protein n=1 Tax=Rehmannia glutinosa TaxID=99300 RepID=A0ABR0UVY3_REHGL
MLPLSTLLKSGFTPTLKDFNNFLFFLSRNQRFKAIIHVFSQLSSNEINADAQTHTIFTKALLKEHKYEEAADFLKTLAGESNNFRLNRVFDSLVQGLCTFNQDPERGLCLLKDFLKIDGVCPSSRTFCLLICCSSQMGKMDRVIDLLELMSDDKLKYPFDNYVCSSVISGFVRIGEPELAVGFYETAVKSDGNIEKAVGFLYKMRWDGLEPNLVTYTAIILGFCKKGKLDEAFAIFGMLKRLGIEADEFTYAILIHGVCRRGDFDLVFQLLDEMEKRGINPGVVTYNTVINGLSKVGRTSDADGFSKGIVGDVVTYSTLLQGYVREKNNSGF